MHCTGTKAGQAASSQSAALLPNSTWTGVFSCAYLAIITRAWIREYNDVKPQRAKVKGHGQGTRYNTVRAGTAQWVSKLRWSAGSLSVDETGKKIIFMALFLDLNLFSRSRRSYTPARRPISFSIARTHNEQRSANKPSPTS